VFDVGNNLLQGSVPDCLVACLMLLVLILSNNNFDGNIPSALGNMRDIQEKKIRSQEVFLHKFLAQKE